MSTVLRKPYEWELSFADTERMVKALKTLLKPFRLRLQCISVDTKAVKLGVRLDIFLLGWRPGLCGPGTRTQGVTRDQWENITTAVLLVLGEFMPGVKVPVQRWRKEAKFDLIFQTYIAYTERRA